MTRPRHEQVHRPTATSPNGSEDGFSERIRALTQAYGGASQIAKTCGFSEGVVRSWRDGRSDPSRERCVALARGLGISLLWLVAGEGTMRDSSYATTPPAGMATTITDTEVDSRRLSGAMRMLQSTLDATGNSLSIDAHADLLAEYYAALGNPDPVARAEGMLETQRHLVERIKHTRST
jgi:hypothetical protein